MLTFISKNLTEWIYLTNRGNLWDQNGAKIRKGTILNFHNYLRDHLYN